MVRTRLGHGLAKLIEVISHETVDGLGYLGWRRIRRMPFPFDAVVPDQDVAVECGIWTDR
jgi:hypothetical protein